MKAKNKYLKKYQSIIFAFFLIFVGLNVFAQKENNNWLFGDGSKLEFSTNPPSFSTEGQITQNKNSIAYSDPLTGALEFYTDGHFIWNANHNLMQGSIDEFNNNSDITSLQIAPYPNHYGKFFIFIMVDGVAYYSLIDILGNNGRGSVILLNENVPGLPTSQSYYLYSNQLIVKRNDNNSYWLITTAIDDSTGHNNFYSTIIDENGISSNPIISNPVSFGRKGVMAISPDNNYIVYVFMDDTVGRSISRHRYGGFFNILSFNNSNGNINYIGEDYNLMSDDVSSLELFITPETNELLLYVCGLNNYHPSIIQYKVNPSATYYFLNQTWSVSGNIIYTGYGLTQNLPTMRKGQDGKLYFHNLNLLPNNQHKLSVINNPRNIGGACNYTPEVINMGNHNSYNLPARVVAQPSCVYDRDMHDTYVSGDYVVIQVNHNITADNTIQANAHVEYLAGNSIRLLPGFKALNGSDFTAAIDGCSLSTYKPNVTYQNTDITAVKTKDVNLYPNPVQNVIKLKSDKTVSKVLIVDKSGYVLKTYKHFKQQNLLKLDVKMLQKGFYFVKIFFDDGTSVTRNIIK